MGTIVRVEALLLSDGTWEMISIAPLGELTDVPDCATVIATVVSVDGNEIQFLGWPTTVKIELEDDNDNEENSNDDENGTTKMMMRMVVTTTKTKMTWRR